MEQTLPVAENKNIGYDFSRGVLPEASKASTLIKMQDFNRK
jgi:hypothetical protein